MASENLPPPSNPEPEPPAGMQLGVQSGGQQSPRSGKTRSLACLHRRSRPVEWNNSFTRATRYKCEDCLQTFTDKELQQMAKIREEARARRMPFWDRTKWWLFNKDADRSPHRPQDVVLFGIVLLIAAAFWYLRIFLMWLT